MINKIKAKIYYLIFLIAHLITLLFLFKNIITIPYLLKNGYTFFSIPIFIKFLQIFIIILCTEYLDNIFKGIMRYKEFIMISFLLYTLNIMSDIKDINSISYFKQYIKFINYIELFILLLITIIKKKLCVPSERKSLYKSREVTLIKLNEYLNKNENKAILINGKWGIGKTFLVEYFFEEYPLAKNKFIPIWIKTTIFKDKLEIRDYILNEIKLILIDLGLATNSIQDIISFFNLKSSIFNFNLFKNTFQINRDKIRIQLQALKEKNIVLVIDDLDRKEPKEITEIISLIAEVEDFFNLKLIFLLDENKILDTTQVDKNFFEKYFSKKIELFEVSFEEIISKKFENKNLKKIESSFVKYFKVIFSNSDNPQFKTIIEEINTPRRLNLFFEEINWEQWKKIENELEFVQLTWINTHFFYFLEKRPFKFLSNEIFSKISEIEKVSDIIYNKINFETKNIYIYYNFLDANLLNSFKEAQENIFSKVSKEYINIIQENYNKKIIKNISEIKTDIEIWLYAYPIDKNKKDELVIALKNYLIFLHNEKK